MDDEWVSKLHKHLWELQGIWRSMKEHTVVLNKFGIWLPGWSWVSFKQVMGIVVQISRVAEVVEKEVMQKSRSEWAQWAKQAIQKGARLAHKVTQARVFQSVLDTEWAGSQQVLPQPKDAADAELAKWEMFGQHIKWMVTYRRSCRAWC